jgi:hypothetical protein
VTTAWLVTAWCVGFAVATVVLETSSRFETGPYADYAAGLTVMSWIVFGLKLAGAAAALASIRPSPRVPPAVLSGVLWGAHALLGLYSAGSVVEAIGMLTGLAGSADEITVAGVLYVVFFLLGAAGFGVLAVSFSRRFGVGRGAALVGVVTAPVGLGLLLLAIPLLLVAIGVMPEY